jgi:hypothetical protein
MMLRAAHNALAGASRALECTRLGAAAQAVGIALPKARPTTPTRMRRSGLRSASRSTSSRASSSSSPRWRRAPPPRRELLYKACAMTDRNEPGLGTYSSMAKLFASDKRDARHRRGDPDPGRLRLCHRVFRSSATCATPRSPRSRGHQRDPARRDRERHGAMTARTRDASASSSPSPASTATTVAPRSSLALCATRGWR